jgi:hypothetical protein
MDEIKTISPVLFRKSRIDLRALFISLLYWFNRCIPAPTNVTVFEALIFVGIQGLYCMYLLAIIPTGYGSYYEL